MASTVYETEICNAYTTLNWGAGGIRDLTLDANKIEPNVYVSKSSFPKSVSTTFVAHCSFTTNNAGSFRKKG